MSYFNNPITSSFSKQAFREVYNYSNESILFSFLFYSLSNYDFTLLKCYYSKKKVFLYNIKFSPYKLPVFVLWSPYKN